MFMDFGALPPEINSIRIYTGPGPAPLLAASTAWQSLATELSLAATGYQSQVSGLAAGWQGEAGRRMATAAAPHIQWLNVTSAQAAQAATQAAAQAAAYEAAFAATVPPPVIAANRSLQMSLIATNFLGQNTPAITATEALYMEMWAQCAAAMYGYAAATEQSSVLPAFEEPRQNTDPSGQLRQAAANAKAAGDTTANNAGVVGTKVAAETPPAVKNPLDYVTDMYGDYKPTDALNDTLEPIYRIAGFSNSFMSIAKGVSGSSKAVSSGTDALTAPAVVPGLLGGLGQAGALSSAPVSSPIAASLANATRLGGLSVPSTWSGAVPPVNAAASPLAAANLGSAVGNVGTGPSHMAGAMPLANAAGAGGRGIGDGVLRVGSRAFTMPRPPSAG
ncbi:PPE family protein [Mycolicibacillus trivialis]|uniref:PPE family protein n=1 Tax=Mycolicibacillus trivialis TaxID=1798 RepID=A0A1X2EQS8_9MYCO|nr:PPE family protein [Mycolicibacillus trivialis]ORX08610.1 hypothetical protein AWC30_01460 [Mycolicibacillus trivialis]